jgi:hypothetical protein
MRWLIAVVAVLLSLTAPAGRAAEESAESVEIPLKEVWALDIPGTRDVRELQEIPQLPPGKELFEKSLIARIILELGTDLPQEVKPGFAVPGVGLEALQQMHDALVKDRERLKSFRQDDQITIAFFSYTFGQYLRLDGIARSDDAITIKYHFVAHASLDSTVHFALIPLGALPSGDYEVFLERQATKTSGVLDAKGAIFIDPDLLKRAVCGPFSFTVN